MDLDFQFPIVRTDCRLSGLETLSPIRIIIRDPTRRVLIWDGEVTADITTRANTGIGDTAATTIQAKAIISATSGVIAMAVTGKNIRGISGAASRNTMGTDEMNISPGDGSSWHNGWKPKTGLMEKNKGLRLSPQALLTFCQCERLVLQLKVHTDFKSARPIPMWRACPVSFEFFQTV